VLPSKKQYLSAAEQEEEAAAIDAWFEEHYPTSNVGNGARRRGR
jgi:hypothetical protein